MSRMACWCMAVASTAGAIFDDRPVPAVVLGVVALGWMRCAAYEAERSGHRWAK